MSKAIALAGSMLLALVPASTFAANDPGRQGGGRAQPSQRPGDNGSVDFDQLTVEEQIEVARYIRHLREREKRDDRTPREKCIDAEIASAGGTPSPLAMRVIDLKCSQR